MKPFFEKLYFYLLIAELSTAVSRIFGGEPNPGTDAQHTSNRVLLLFNMLVVIGTFTYCVPRLPRIWRALLRLKWIFILYLWMLLSILWSVDRMASVTSGLYTLLYLIAAAYFALSYSMEEVRERLSECAFVGACLSVLGEFLLPPPNDLAPGWSGIFSQKNGLGLCMMIAIALLMVERKPWSVSRTSKMAFYILLLLLSQSFTAVMAATIVICFISFQRLGGRKKAFFWIAASGASVILLVLVPDPMSLILQAGGKNSSFTGRDVIWAFALLGIAERPLCGHGYAAFWSGASDTIGSSLSWNPHHAHNGLLQICLDLGLVGLLLSIGVLVNMLRRALRLRKYDPSHSGFWVLVLLLITSIHNSMESDLLSLNVVWFMLMLSSFSLLKKEEEIRATRMFYVNHAPSDRELLALEELSAGT